ncbi:MAG: DUF456 domain-containing protein [Tepidisphaeraceae bacterium]|jgi:uncharacterized protein YqgC (DUF456 family)
MPWLYFILLLLLASASLLLVVVTLPGLWLMSALAGGYAVLTHQRYLGWHTLVALLILSLAGEIVEISLGGIAAKKAGGGRRAAWGGIIGGVVGGIVFSFIPIPIVATLLGIFLGTFLGAGLMELLGGESTTHSLRVGLGATKGRLMGLFAKITIGVVMLLIIIFTALPI